MVSEGVSRLVLVCAMRELAAVNADAVDWASDALWWAAAVQRSELKMISIAFAGLSLGGGGSREASLVLLAAGDSLLRSWKTL